MNVLTTTISKNLTLAFQLVQQHITIQILLDNVLDVITIALYVQAPVSMSVHLVFHLIIFITILVMIYALKLHTTPNKIRYQYVKIALVIAKHAQALKLHNVQNVLLDII